MVDASSFFALPLLTRERGLRLSKRPADLLFRQLNGAEAASIRVDCTPRDHIPVSEVLIIKEVPGYINIIIDKSEVRSIGRAHIL